LDSGRFTRTLLWAGAASGPLFVALFLLGGALTTDYEALSHPVSGLALGDLGWLQATNFLLAGLLALAYAVGLRWVLRAHPGGLWVPLLVGAYAVGLIGSGLFATDPVSGFPPGTDPLLTEYSPTGAAHDAFGVPVFIGLPIAIVVMACALFRWGRSGWAWYSLASAAVFVAGFVLASLAFAQVEPWAAWGGLLQRLTIVSGQAWLTLLALALLSAPPFRPRPLAPPEA
jgi:hypothetical protein